MPSLTDRVIEPRALLALIGIFLDTFIYPPLIIYWTRNIWRQRNSLIIRKRHFPIITTIGWVSCLYYLIQRNIGFLIYSDILSSDITLILTYANCYLYPIFNYGLFYIMVYRYWLLYFKTKFAAAQTNGKWQMIINPVEADKNWWIMNKKKFGSGHYLKKYILLLLCFIVIIEGTLWIFAYYLDSYPITYIALFIDLLIVLFPLILTIYIRQNLPLLIDKLRIKQELKYIFLIILLAFIIIAVLSSIVAALSYFIIDFTQNILYSVYNAISNISTFGTFLCIYFQTQWVINKFRSHLHLFSSRQMLKTTLTQQILLTKKEKNENKDKISISDVLTHKQAFHVFMGHLIEEHSSECLLSLIEMIQFKDSILNDIKIIPVLTTNLNNSATEAVERVSKISKIEEDSEQHDGKIDNDEIPEKVNGRSSEVERNIKALTLALSGTYNETFLQSATSTSPRNTPTRGRGTSGSIATANGLIMFPKTVPKSAIVYNKELNFLADVPGVEISPNKKRGISVDKDVVKNSALIRHVSSRSNNNMQAVWQQKRSSTLKKNIDITDLTDNANGNNESMSIEVGLINRKHSLKKKEKNKSKKSIVLNRSEGELIEEYKIRGYMLYYKYVAIGSEFEINIDYGTRNKLILQVNDINQWLKDESINLHELSVIFDNCIHQMYQFCKFSMGRFKQSDGFEALVRCFNIVAHQEEAPALLITNVSP